MDEFTLIREVFAAWPPADATVVLGIGDDAALLQPPPGEQLVVTSDTLVAGRHFDPSVDAGALGWKALAVNLSDLAAMGATPRWFTLALTLPGIDGVWVRAFASGLRALAARYSVTLVGGDTTRGPLSVTVTAFGTVAPGTALRRDVARVDDVICVSGPLGDAALALRRRQRVSPTVAADAALSRRLDWPEPRVDVGLALAGSGAAAIDVSDGLAGDLGHILAASRCGAVLDAGALPRSNAFSALASVEQAIDLQLHGGDDYELCICLPRAVLTTYRAAHGDTTLHEIGRIVAEPGLWLDTPQGRQTLEPRGYDHFRQVGA